MIEPCPWLPEQFQICSMEKNGYETIAPPRKGRETATLGFKSLCKLIFNILRNVIQTLLLSVSRFLKYDTKFLVEEV